MRLLLFLSLLLASCGPKLTGAVPLKGVDSTWVYIQTKGGYKAGVYYCTHGKGSPYCYRARMK